MPKSLQRKEETRRRILDAAGRQFRAAGLNGAGVAEIMAAAGLTHGGFYAHFADKAALAAAALEAALEENRVVWLAGLGGLSQADAYRRIAGRYLSPAHRDNPAEGCAMAALASELARPGGSSLRAVFTAAFAETLRALEPFMPAGERLRPRERALATAALALGGLLLARIVDDETLSNEVLLACRRAALAALGPHG